MDSSRPQTNHGINVKNSLRGSRELPSALKEKRVYEKVSTRYKYPSNGQKNQPKELEPLILNK